MKFHYQDDFLEAAVLVCTSGRRKGIPSLSVARFNFEREKLYRIAEPDERDAAFFRLHAMWFQEWGLERFLLNLAHEFAEMESALPVLAFRKARNRKDEGSELYVNTESERRGVVALRAERFADEPDLACFLRHEFTHLNDMLDPAFGYIANLVVPGGTDVQQRLARERYRVLWDITIDSRLLRAKHAVGAGKEMHRGFFDRAFSFWPDSRRAEVFEALWAGPRTVHAELAALAVEGRGHDPAAGPAPGMACPLCGMPAFDWADAGALAELEALIRGEFADWKRDRGACGRCAEVYGALRTRRDGPGMKTGVTEGDDLYAARAGQGG